MELPDPCAECRFDGRHYNASQVRETRRTLASRWYWLMENTGTDALTAPDPDGGPSVMELWERFEEALGAESSGDVNRDRAGVHVSSHALHQAGRMLHALGAGPPSGSGEVVGVFASGGGVPKTPVEKAVVGYRGVEGDHQNDRRYHGMVWQALCLWSADVVDRLRAEGHLIAPGNAGENVSVTGVDWAALRPGVQLRIGTVLAEVTAYAAPCAKNAQWFLNRDFHRMDHHDHPGWSRLYAAVMEDGVMCAGDEVTVEP